MDDGSITRLLREVREGLPGAEDRLFERIYTELRAMASARLVTERTNAPDGEATDIVHAAFERVNGTDLENRRQLFFAYTRAMRQVLIDRARRNKALKRGGNGKQLALRLDDLTANHKPAALGAVEVTDLLDRLRATSEREAHVVELRFFGGLSDANIGILLGVSERTVRNDWGSARLKLAKLWDK